MSHVTQDNLEGLLPNCSSHPRLFFLLSKIFNMVLFIDSYISQGSLKDQNLPNEYISIKGIIKMASTLWSS